MEFGLVGAKLGHSFSPQIHLTLGDYKYELCEVALSEFEGFFKNADWQGLNITMPYKKLAAQYCDELSDVARETMSVNTAVRRANGSIFGDNTDYFGLESIFKNAEVSLEKKRVLILGNGGASQTAQCLARRNNAAEVLVASRGGALNFENLQNAQNAEIIINTTPVGMFPNVGSSPIDLSRFQSAEFVCDIVYNPIKTRLVLDAKERNIKACGGLLMLAAQAIAASAIFTGNRVQDVMQIYKQVLKQTQNIVIIGMPGSGKTTVGGRLARELGRELIDIDLQIEKDAEMPIADIFVTHGEKYFRELEHRTIVAAGLQNGKIIATGGGSVLDFKNYAPLAQNGVIFYITRPIKMLATRGRPLSTGVGALHKLKNERAKSYEAFADFKINNCRKIALTVAQIKEKFNENPCD